MDYKAGLKPGKRQVWHEKQKEHITQSLWYKKPDPFITA